MNAPQKFKVGITGGIGSGKSYISKIIEKIGFPVFYSDVEAKKIVSENLEVHRQLVELLGEEVFINNQLNAPFLAQKLFDSEQIRSAVNGIIHPIVHLAFENWCKKSDVQIVFNEAAILFETGGFKRFDATILVTAPLDVKIKRILERDTTTLENINKRMDSQWSDDDKKKLADFTIENDGRPVLTQIETIIEKISSLRN